MIGPPDFTAPVHFWRIDRQAHATGWDSGAGAELGGGRWNLKGVGVVYGALDPATSILEIAVHAGFDYLDTEPHVLTCARLDRTEGVHVVRHEDVPNPNWLTPGTPSIGQQRYGSELIRNHPVVLIPSVICKYSWNLLLNTVLARDAYALAFQEPFALDPRLNLNAGTFRFGPSPPDGAIL